MLFELLQITVDALYYGDRAVKNQKYQNECLIAKICEAKYDQTSHAWIVIPKTTFIHNGRSYNIKECLCANTCHYDFTSKSYLPKPSPNILLVSCNPSENTFK